jgi:hypothetical protein
MRKKNAGLRENHEFTETTNSGVCRALLAFCCRGGDFIVMAMLLIIIIGPHVLIRTAP